MRNLPRYGNAFYASALLLCLIGCGGTSTVDKGTAIGAVAGAVAGAALTGGSVAGAAGGAAVGGLVGHEVGMDTKKAEPEVK